ncbi:tumor necrosis factor receptor superfamily member 13B [Scomber scombrus]|uniref:tumor necrosis factor receptor superfamily member 13B n=1 Tax=Scomber scombrus TaxID=13677 RepID=UPI002DDA57D6|nr:tumor necrosis factor receptor superfamily member 13B [Scomber scombrus]
MGCPEGEYRDPLVKSCMSCRAVCMKPQIIPRCNRYCESEHCKSQPGNYYDGLLKKCVRCSQVCGRHPAECFQLCQKNSKGFVVSTALEDPTIVLYSLLGLCMVLLLSSLSLALAVLIRGGKAKKSKQVPKAANHTQELLVQPGQEVGQQGFQPERRSKDCVPNSSLPTYREPLEDSSPTETCVCVHCFPDLTALSQSNDRPLRAPFSFYQQAVPQRPQVQKGGLRYPEESLHIFGLEAQEEAAVG